MARTSRVRGGAANDAAGREGASTGRGADSRAAGTTWLPTGRALLGSALIGTAVAGVLLTQRAASQPPTTRYVVVTESVAAGRPVRAEDLGTLAAELPAGTSAVPDTRAGELVGRIARVPLRPMDLLREGDLYDRGRFTADAATEIALELTPAQALLGTLQVGDRVDVLSTDPDGVGTTTIATRVAVSQVDDGDQGGIGGAGTVQVRIGVPDAVTAETVIDAAVRTDVSLALTAPAARDGGPR